MTGNNRLVVALSRFLLFAENFIRYRRLLTQQCDNPVVAHLVCGQFASAENFGCKRTVDSNLEISNIQYLCFAREREREKTERIGPYYADNKSGHITPTMNPVTTYSSCLTFFVPRLIIATHYNPATHI